MTAVPDQEIAAAVFREEAFRVEIVDESAFSFPAPPTVSSAGRQLEDLLAV